MSTKKKPKKSRRDKTRGRVLSDSARYKRYQDQATDWARTARLTLRHLGDDEYDGDWSFNAAVPAGKKESIATFATHAPQRWHITAVAAYRNDKGEERTYQAEAECGQAQKIDELRGLRDELMQQCRLGNANHAWDEYFLMRVL